MRRYATWLAPVLLAGALSACSESEASPPRVDAPSLECGEIERSLYAEDGPARSIRAAMGPYLRSGERLRILERHSGTAIVFVDRRRSTIRAELVRTGGGWVRTSVVRCH